MVAKLYWQNYKAWIHCRMQLKQVHHMSEYIYSILWSTNSMFFTIQTHSFLDNLTDTLATFYSLTKSPLTCRRSNVIMRSAEFIVNFLCKRLFDTSYVRLDSIQGGSPTGCSEMIYMLFSAHILLLIMVHKAYLWKAFCITFHPFSWCHSLSPLRCRHTISSEFVPKFVFLTLLCIFWQRMVYTSELLSLVHPVALASRIPNILKHRVFFVCWRLSLTIQREKFRKILES